MITNAILRHSNTKKNMRTLSLLVLSLTLASSNIYACSCNGAIAYAKKVHSKKGKLPDPKLRRYVFECTGLVPLINKFDVLDRDLIYMKASSYTRERFDEATLKDGSERTFKEVLPKKNVQKLFDVLSTISSKPTKKD